MAIDMSKPDDLDDGIVDAEIVEEPTRLQAARAAAAEKLAQQRPAVKAAYTDQKTRVRSRIAAWFATADIDDHALSEEIVQRKRKAVRDADDQLIRDVARLRGRLAEAQGRAAQLQARHGDERSSARSQTSPEIARITGQLTAAEARLEARAHEGPEIAVLPPTSKELGRARWAKKATRVGIVLGGSYGWLHGIAVEPGLLLAPLVAGPVAWWYLARPADEGEQDPFGQPPTALPHPAAGAGPIGGPSDVHAAADGATADGRHITMTIEQLPEDAKPFPVSHARTPEQLALCVLLAMRAEGVPVVEVSNVIRHQWGWECVVRVSEGTPEAIIKAAGGLETKFDLPANGVRPQPMLERRACAKLRLVSGDPFASAPGMPYRAPKSLSITDKYRIGTSVGGDPLNVCLAGVMGLWVAASGGGKTGILQALAEGTTACRDNITIDLDPHGDGLEDLHDAVRITARTQEQIESVLLFFLVMSKARARLRAKLGMGKKWKASPQHPAVTIFFDEFPKASELAKRLAFDLLLVGRKELIEVEIASQGGTKLYLGENIAQMIAMKGVGPCKVGDTRAVFGDGAVNEGWLPHRLSPATDTDPKDAGHIYIQGVPGLPDEPIEYAVHETQSSVLRQLAAERLDAGLVEPDSDSLNAMPGVDLPEYVEPVFDAEGGLKREAPVRLLTWDQLLRLCGAQPAENSGSDLARALVADAVDLMDKAGVDRMRTETLLVALAEHDPGAYGGLAEDRMKALLREAGVGAPVTLGPLDGMANPRGFKRKDLARAV